MCNDTAIKHDEAMKYDGEKVRLDLLPADPIIDVGKVLTYGARKYTAENWRKGLAWSRCYGAALRHLLAWHKGETNDPETGLNHLAHAACEILFLLEFTRTHLELDDRPSTLNPSSRLRPGPEVEKSNLDKSETETLEVIKPADAPSPDPEQKSWIDCVKEFNEAYDVPTWSTIESMDVYTCAVAEQMALIAEEHRELEVAYKMWCTPPFRTKNDEAAILDAICDSIYVLIGLALKMGFKLDFAFREVHRSNMSKLGEDGKPIKRADGKILKGPNFTPPKLDAYI